jgi:hypothetical protein
MVQTVQVSNQIPNPLGVGRRNEGKTSAGFKYSSTRGVQPLSNLQDSLGVVLRSSSTSIMMKLLVRSTRVLRTQEYSVHSS